MEVLVYVKLIDEIGYDQAVFGDGLSFGKTSSIEFEDFLKGEFEELAVSCAKRTEKLSKMERGHDGALKMIQTWWDIKAPRNWWVQMDTYGVGKAQRSESTMHTITSKYVTPEDFEGFVFAETIKGLNKLIKKYAYARQYSTKRVQYILFKKIKNNLPESYLQRRIVNLNYMGLKNIIIQRKTHRLEEWKFFIDEVLKQVNHPELLP
jgi:hypothetical protein